MSDDRDRDADVKPERRRERPDGGQVEVVGEEELGLLDRFVELKQRQWFLLAGSALVLVVLPYLMIDGLTMASEALTGTDDFAGYEGLPSLVLVFAIAVIGFDLLLGYTKLLSFGHAAFFGTAAYAAAIFSEQVAANPLVMVLVGGLIGTALALPIGFLSIRRSGVYFAVLTLTFAQMLFFWVRSPGAWLTRGSTATW
jgi:branched-chain amino acid transport system permease protein